MGSPILDKSIICIHYVAIKNMAITPDNMAMKKVKVYN
jgi:hypothetical protein